MKKFFLVLLALSIAGLAFAEVEASISGGLQMDMGVLIPTGDYADASEWYWDTLGNGGTYIQANAEGENISAWVMARADGAWMGVVKANLGSFDLSVGHNRLPVKMWSSFNLWGDNHFAFGASSTARTPFIQADFAGVFLGLADGGAMNGWKAKEESWSPYFYFGYNFKPEDGALNAGFAFVGSHLSAHITGTTDSAFTFMGKAYATFDLDPLAFGLNVALYNKTSGFFSISNNPIAWMNNDMVLEALLDFGVGLEPCSIGLGLGLVVGLGKENEGGGGLGFKAGLSADFDLGGTGLVFCPGLALTSFNFGHDIKSSQIDIGISFMYNF